MADPITEDTRVGWVTIKEVIELWGDAPGEPDEDYAPLPGLLRVAQGELVRYAPRARFTPGEEPENAKLAQVLLAKHLSARKNTGDGSNMGADGFMQSTYPLVLEAKGLVKRWRSPFTGMR